MKRRGHSFWPVELHRRLAVLPRRLVSLSLAVMLVILTASGYLLDRSWQGVENDQAQTAWNLALMVSDDFRRSIQSLAVKLDATVIAARLPGGPATLSHRTATVPHTSDELGALVGLDAQGHVTFSTSTQFWPGEDLSGLDAYRLALTSHLEQLGQPFTVADEQWLPVAMAIHQPDGETTAEVTMLRLSDLQKSFIAQGLVQGDLISVFELNGPELLRSPASPPGTDPLAVGRQLTRLLGGAEIAGSIGSSVIDHSDRLSVVMSAGQWNIGVMVAVPVAVLWQVWWPLAFWIIGLAGLLLLMMLAFLYALGGELQRRKQAETEASAAVVEAYERYSARYRLLADNSSDAIMQIGLNFTCRYASPATQTMLGWPCEDLVGRQFLSLVHPADLDRLLKDIQSGGGPIQGRSQFRHLRKNGSYLWVEMTMRPVLRNGTPECFVANLRDISKRVDAERRLKETADEMARLAGTDQLTGLANRRSLDEKLESEWARAARDQYPLSVLLLDIDHFKAFNDSYGHPAGDEALIKVARVAANCTNRAGDLAVRWGGEEFMLLLPGTELEGAVAVAERLRATVEALSVPHRGSPIERLTVSIGVATAFPRGDGVPESLIATADVNLYSAKHGGRNQVSSSQSRPMSLTGT